MTTTSSPIDTYTQTMPPNVSINTNMSVANQYATSPQNSGLDSYLWFYNKVKNNKDGSVPDSWDYKQQGSQYAGLGNFNYGATGTAMGIPEAILLRMAGVAQIRAGTSNSKVSALLGVPPYGDDLADQANIKAGIEYAKQQGYGASLSSAWIKDFLKFAFDLGNSINGIEKFIADLFNGAQRTPQRHDPLTLDLNGDGIQTVPLSTPPLFFDLTASGIKTSVGWIAPSDGLLVMDRNGNGMIDSGAELFGDATPAYAAGTSSPSTGSGRTVDGFAALAQEDTNGDGLVNNLDTNFASLRVWQDANQDGISQANELKTLTDAGIASFNVSRSTHSQTLANGNQIADVGTFTRTDGTTGTAGSVNGMADVNLAVDAFTSSFTDTIPLTVQAQTLPDMQGSGMVREMRQAASLQTTTGQTFAAALAQYNAATTREEQLAQIDQLISAWGATAEMGTLQTGRCKRLAANDVELGKRRLG